jgi:hypothetical protein
MYFILIQNITIPNDGYVSNNPVVIDKKPSVSQVPLNVEIP